MDILISSGSSNDSFRYFRSCSQKERRELALNLAEKASPKLLKELERMTDARSRKFFQSYGYEDQLTGIEALGKTANPQALRFLSRVYSSVYSVDNQGAEVPNTFENSVQWYKRLEVTCFSFPWANGQLKRDLYFQLSTSDIKYDLTCQSSRDALIIESESIFSKNPHIIMQKAIKDLESSTGEENSVFTYSEAGDFYKIFAQLASKFHGSQDPRFFDNFEVTPQGFMKKQSIIA